jgi:periplasmic divalent cation tolerance protein
MSQFAVVSTTVESRDEAEKLANLLVEERLAACVQFVPVNSVYRWKDKVESASECLLLAKTRRVTVPRLMARIQEAHSYDVPEIIVTPIIDGSKDYLKWVADQVDDA